MAKSSWYNLMKFILSGNWGEKVGENSYKIEFCLIFTPNNDFYAVSDQHIDTLLPKDTMTNIKNLGDVRNEVLFYAFPY